MTALTLRRGPYSASLDTWLLRAAVYDPTGTGRWHFVANLGHGPISLAFSFLVRSRR